VQIISRRQSGTQGSAKRLTIVLVKERAADNSRKHKDLFEFNCYTFEGAKPFKEPAIAVVIQ
jgi:hypothetical protein